MSTTTVKSLVKKAFGLLLTGLLLLPGSGVYAMGDNVMNETELSAKAGIPLQPVSYLTAESITSTSDNDEDEPVNEGVTIPYTTGKSLWFNDGSLATQIVRTHNKGSVRHLTGGKVQIVVYQEGNGGLYTRVDGAQRPVLAETIESSVQSNKQYSRIRYTIDYNSVVNPDAPYTIFTAGILQLSNSGSRTRYEVNVYIYWDKSNLPDAPNVSFAYDNASDKMVLAGANSKMEYRLRAAGTDAWQPCTDEPMYFDVATTAGAAYYVRYSADENNKASQVKEIVLPVRRAAPAATYNSITETFRGLSNTMEIRFGDGSYEPLTDTTLEVSDIIDTIADGETLTVNIREKGTATLPAGLTKDFTLYPRAAKPTSVTFNPASLTLTGCTTAMQYRLDTAATWTYLSTTTINLVNFASADRDVIIYVRTSPTSTRAASKPIAFTIPKLLDGPVGTLDYDKEIISGLEPGAYQYNVNGGSWTNLNITDGTWNISSLITTAERTIYLRKAATSTTPITANTVFTIPRRPVAPATPKFVYDDADNPDKIIFSGLTTDMEYRRSTDTNWTDVPASGLVYDPQKTSVVYYVRNKATTDTWASAYRSVTMAAMPSAPKISYNQSTETLTNLRNTYEISFDGGAYTGLTSSTYNLSEKMDNIPPNGTLLVSVRSKATATAPAGQVATITINARESTSSLSSIIK